MIKMLGADIVDEFFIWVKNIAYIISEWFFGIFYSIWSALASIVDVMETVFQMFAGLKPIQQSKSAPVEQAPGVEGKAPNNYDDITSWIINQPVIKTLFQNLIVFAIILMMFFTIIVIIREQYKNTDASKGGLGGNPYLIVFRSFKGIIMMLFITAAVLVGLKVSGVILTGLNKVTGLREDDSVSGQIFMAMASRANRYNFYSYEPEKVNALDTADNTDVGRAKRKQELWQTHPTEPVPKSNILYFVDKESQLTGEKKKTIYTPYLTAEKDFRMIQYTYSWDYNALEGDQSEGWRYRMVQTGSNIDVTNSIGDKLYPTLSGEYTSGNRNITQPTGFTYRLETKFESEDLAYQRWSTMLSKVATYKTFIADALRYYPTGEGGGYDMSTFLTRDEQNSVTPTLISKSPFTTQSKVGTFVIWVPELLPHVAAYATSNPDERKYNFHVRAQQGDFKREEPENISPSNSKKTAVIHYFPYASMVDNQMRKKFRADKPTEFGCYLYMQQYRVQAMPTSGILGPDIVLPISDPKWLGPMSYNNKDAVMVFYDVSNFNFIIGFLGILMVAGVYMSFVFGLLQRVMSLAILYVLSPLTLAFYPFDDGASFNNNFVRPFYKQVISVYAVILSLNIFFLIYPVFNKITFFEPLGQDGLTTNWADYLMQIFITLALIGMLPKMRSMITGMLGADSIEERGVGQVFNDARNATWGNQNFKDVGRAAKFAAKQAGRPVKAAYGGFKKYAIASEANQPRAYEAKRAKLQAKVGKNGYTQEMMNTDLAAFQKKQIEGGFLTRSKKKLADSAVGSAYQSFLKSSLGQAAFDSEIGAFKDAAPVKFFRSNSRAERLKEIKKLRDRNMAEDTELAKASGTRSKAAIGLGQEFAKVGEVEAKMQALGFDPSMYKTAKDYDQVVKMLEKTGETQAAVYLANRKDDYFKAQSSIGTKSAEMGLSASKAQAMGAAYANTVGVGRAKRHEKVENDANAQGITDKDEILRMKQESDLDADQEWTRHVESLDADKITAFADAKTNSEMLSGVYSAAGAEKIMEMYGDEMAKVPPAMREAMLMDKGLVEIMASDNPHKHMEVAKQLRMLAEDPNNANLVVGNELRELVKKGGNKTAYQMEKIAGVHDMMGSTAGVMSGTSVGAGHNVGAFVTDVALLKKHQELLETNRVRLDSQISDAEEFYHKETMPDVIAQLPKQINAVERASFDLNEIAESQTVLDANINAKRRELIKFCETNKTSIEQSVLHELKQVDEIVTKYEKGTINESTANTAFTKSQANIRKNMPSEIVHETNILDEKFGADGLTGKQIIEKMREPGSENKPELNKSAQLLRDKLYQHKDRVDKDFLVSFTRAVETSSRLIDNTLKLEDIIEKKGMIDNSLSKYNSTIEKAMKEE